MVVKLEKKEPFVSPTLHSDAELTGVAIFSIYYPGLYQKLYMILNVFRRKNGRLKNSRIS